MKRILAATTLLAIGFGASGALAASGKFVLYTSQPNADAQATVDAFTAANPGVEVEWVRDGTTKIMAKLRAEIAAGQPMAGRLLVGRPLVRNWPRQAVGPAIGCSGPEPHLQWQGHRSRLGWQPLCARWLGQRLAHAKQRLQISSEQEGVGDSGPALHFWTRSSGSASDFSIDLNKRILF